jgi:hypothetical protein
VNGFGVIGRLTDHFRKYAGSAKAPVLFEIHGRVGYYRLATVKPDGKATIVTLVKTERKK